MNNMKLQDKMKKVIKNPRLVFMYLFAKINLKFIPDTLYLKLEYLLYMNKKLNLKDPKSFNEKLQWLKLNDRNSKYVNLVDKYEVRNHIAETIGEEYLIPLLGVYDKFEDINFDKLPQKFVLKPTHTSGDIFICKDKANINYPELQQKVNKWLKRNYYWVHREWPYKLVKLRIIIEHYLKEPNEKMIKDYKFMCFNGNVRCSFVVSNRNSDTGMNVDFFDIKWDKIPVERHYRNSKERISKPKNYEKMIEIAEKLASDIPFVRIDFYEINGKIYFGEMTFYPGSGIEEFTPEIFDYEFGSYLVLPLEKENGNEHKR